MMTLAGIQPDAEVDLQVVWWMSREAQRRERARWAFIKAMLTGQQDSLKDAMADEED